MWTEAQKKALDTDGRLLVSASAGSGKTTVMMERAARFLEQGGDVSRMVVLTFTKAAAAEMKEKLLKILYERIRQGVNREHLMRTVKKIPLARICTIDSFCLDLYRTYFERLGLSPDLMPMETGESEMMFRNAARETLANAADGEEKTLFFLERYTKGQKLESLIEIMVRLWRFAAVKPEPEGYLLQAVQQADGVLEEDLKEKRKRAARLIERGEEWKPMLAANWGKGLELLEGVLRNLRLITDCKTYEEYVSTFWKYTEIRMTGGKKDDLQKAWQEDIALLRDSGKALWNRELLDGIRVGDGLECGKGEFFERERGAAADAEILCALTLDAYRRYQDEKEKNSVCDFADLEHIALRLLADGAVVREVRDSVDCVFVDEYQDTNGLQEAILNRFAGEELFLVGDVKQSIYRFRFAEPRLFLDRRRIFGEGTGGQNVDLNHNFRSEPKILQFVNSVMAEVMTQDFGGIDYRRDAMLQAGREDRGTAETEIFLYEKREKGYLSEPEIYSVREGNVEPPPDPVEGEYIADKILKLVGKAKIPAKEGWRTVQYSDIAILTRYRNADDLFAALEKHHIPYYAEGYRGLEGEEKRVLWNLTKVLDNAMQDIPLASVMLSVWGFTEGELMRFAHKQGFAYGALFAPVPAELKEKTDKFRTQLQCYRHRAGFLGVDEILTEIMRETGYDAVLARRGGQALARANAFLYRIQTNKYRRNLSAFLANFQTDADENLPGAADAVRFMTIHKSKGLEFPVVFVAHAHEGFRKNKLTESPMIADAEFGVAMRHRKDYRERVTARYIALAEKQEREDREEQCRLMYVAFTRAGSKLFVSGKAPKRIGVPSEGGNIAEWLRYAAERNPKLQSFFLEGGFEWSSGGEDVGEVFPPATCTAKLEPRYPHEGGVKLGNKYAVSGIEKIDEEEKLHGIGFLGSQSAETGTAYHLIMEKIDFAHRTEEDVERLKKEYAQVPGMQNVDAKILAKALQNPLFDGAENATLMREASFVMCCDGQEVIGEATDETTLIQGVADLVILRPDGAILVDYKVSGAPEQVLKQRYAVQTKMYKRALEQSGISVKECYLLVLNRNLQIKMDE